MKHIFRIVGIGVLMLNLSSCAELLNCVSSLATYWEQSEQSTPEQKAIASMWNEGGTRGKIVVGTAAATDILGAFGVNTSELSSIQEATQNAVANTKATGNEWFDVGLTLAYYGASVADNRIAKKKDRDFEEYAQEHRDLRTNPENKAYYEPYYDLKYEIDYSARTIKERPFYEFMDLLRSEEADAELAKKKEELIAWGIISEWEYEELFGSTELREQNAELYMEYIHKLIETLRRYHYVPGTYDTENKVYKTDAQKYLTIDDAKSTVNASDSGNSIVTNGQYAFDPNDTGLSSGNNDEGQSQTLAARANVSEFVENLERVDVQCYSFNTTDLSPTQKKELDEVVNLLEGNEFSICITGHTCPIGTDQANYNVGYKRAEAAKNYLVSKGVDESRISVVSVGASLPIASNDSVEGRGANRRISFAIQQ